MYEIAVGGERVCGCDIGGGRSGVGAESALADGVRVDTAVDGAVGDIAAQRETNVAGATGAADYPVRCYCRRCQPRLGDASAGTGMTFQTLGKSPCARAAGDASARSMGR